MNTNQLGSGPAASVESVSSAQNIRSAINDMRGIVAHLECLKNQIGLTVNPTNVDSSENYELGTLVSLLNDGENDIRVIIAEIHTSIEEIEGALR